MKTIRMKIAQVVSLLLRNGINRGRLVAAITLLVIAAIAPLAAAALKTFQENVPAKTEKLFSIIVGMVLPVSILSLFFYLQYASDGFTGKLVPGNKSS